METSSETEKQNIVEESKSEPIQIENKRKSGKKKKGKGEKDPEEDEGEKNPEEDDSDGDDFEFAVEDEEEDITHFVNKESFENEVFDFRGRSDTLSGEISDEEDLQKKEEKRVKYIQELLNSEQQHVDSLQTLVVTFVKTLKDKHDILSPENHKLMFGNIEVILNWNMEFSAALKGRLSGGATKKFGDILIEMFPILKQIYIQYSENYEAALVCFSECIKVKEFEEFIRQECKPSNLDLLSMLNIPIRRMIMYHSLLKIMLGYYIAHA